ncbi:LRR receptor-like serine/threonine-protein kinase GSO1 [Vitis vinifera]|uniref:LRR receptor-like serine/threonine-protein kinase GSO1 n=1 Tax=Vitis vinifera TaxID=29760 RepID=A0A438BRU9_VITVI|nr:LRR receptor-like serine/threonine-protein kinase GSO1 [Vitis vinifera]
MHSTSVSGECLSDGRVCLEDEVLLLLQLKSSLIFNTAASNKLVSWIQSADCCSWGGVTWDATGRVVSLDLSSEFISGELNSSSSIFSLQYLQSLNLANNTFSSQIPAEFHKLGNLTYLNLSNAGFSGQIPIEISYLTRLVTIDLSSLYFITGIPNLKLENPNLRMLVQNLKKLRELHLDGVIISAQGKEWCWALSSSVPNLQVLSLYSCHLSGPIHYSLKKLQSLSRIRLDDNNIAAPVPEFLSNFSNLTHLQLSSCGLYGTFPEKIFQGGCLETLVLSVTKFSGKLPNSIANLKRLARIELADCDFSGPIPTVMANLTQLVYLDFSHNKFSGAIPSFSLSKNLTLIDLSHNNLTGQISSSHWDGFVNLVTIDFCYNSLYGSLPMPLFSLPSLQKIKLNNNQFSGPFGEFPATSSHPMDTLDLSGNNLEGPIPVSLFDLQHLNILDLSSNKFNGTVELSQFQKLGNLTTLSLSYNNLSVNPSRSNPTSPLLPILSTLKLASCKLRTLPDLSSQSMLVILDLSQNQIPGKIPNWVWKIGNGSLSHLNLSHNLLEGLQEPLSNLPPFLSTLDLHSNQLRGPIPTPPSSTYVDYSNNRFTSSIPDDIGTYMTFTVFFSLSKNNITGIIPASICNAHYLQVLDFSDNSLSGKIPSCLIENGDLAVLNLRRNKFKGTIPGEFPGHCLLQTLDLNGNLLEGKIPESLANCKALEDAVTVTSKGQEMELVKVLTLFTSIDFSCNNFQGDIPEDIGDLKLLYVLNLSGNGFTGQIPSSLGQLRQLESLDLSLNKLSGEIPAQLSSLNFLSVLNLSFNGLVGRIPTGNQLQTFSENSFAGNRGLCGFPLNVSCEDATAPTFDGRHSGDGGNATTNMLMEFFQGFSIRKTKEEKVVEEEVTEFGGGECSTDEEGRDHWP